MSQNAEAADLELDDFSQQEMGEEEQVRAKKDSKQLQALRNQLKALLSEPLEVGSSSSIVSSVRKMSNSLAKGKGANRQTISRGGVDLRKGKGRGLFVYAK